MRISARGISKGSVLPETTVHARSGEVAVVPVEGGQRPSVLSLILGGRMSPDSGEVALDGAADARALRRAVAIVDAPDVSAPVDDLALHTVLREELAFSGVRGTRRAARRMLADEGLVAYRDTAMGELPAEVRVRVLTETAARRRGVEALVIVSPDRHGGDPRGWYEVARSWADRGLLVIVLAGGASVEAVGALMALERDAHAQVHDVVREPVAAETAPLPVAPPVTVLRSEADDPVEGERETPAPSAPYDTAPSDIAAEGPSAPASASPDPIASRPDAEETER
ncbi:hypothetical protein QMO46_11155 [Microbacterium barkeri]|uniref:hypothetical protein n=1 Tax=Microbacterium barkeri TaxID=33917 RepID=UPI0024AFEAF2|nr:hypothetical protein [Microbacterium barkeri]MDI6944052.1 hypothetical protein [Microbacterium barkeri]